MRFGRLLIRSLWHYRRTHAALVCTAIVCTAILTGALLVGDSLRAGLRHLADLRLGRIEYSLLAGEYPFKADLAERIGRRTGFDTAAVLISDAALETPDGTLRIHRVRVLGVGPEFFEFSHEPDRFAADQLSGPGQIAVSEALGQRLETLPVELILRLDDPSALSRDLIFTADEQTRLTLRITAAHVVPDAALGRFSLQADQQAPLNLFVPRAWLAEQLDLVGRANLLLVASGPNCPSSTAQLNRALAGVAVPEDVGLEWTELAERQMIELQSKRLFISDTIGQAALDSGDDPRGVFTYFVNRLSHGDRATPYSMVTGIGGAQDIGLFETLDKDAIIINEWLADDLDAEAGQRLEIAYFAIGPTNRLIEESHTFDIHQVVPMLGFAADKTLMPPFPGLADAETCLDWEPAIPIDLDRIRDKDEDYWDRHRGTPKAFVSLDTAQQLWANRFGNLTAVRWPMEGNSIESLREQLTEKLQPSELGLFFVDVAEHSRRAGAGSTEFGGLFAGLSMFLILACVIILALIFVFTLQQRSAQAGILLATGWPKRTISKLLLAEGALLALGGALVGMGLGIVYTLGMMAALRTVWQDAVAGAMLRFYAGPWSLLTGAAAGFVIAVAAMGIGLFGRLKRNPISLLSGQSTLSVRRLGSAGRVARWVLLGLCLAGVIAAFVLQDAVLSQEAFFFLIGAVILLISVLLATEAMHMAGRIRKAPSSPARLVLKNIIRRPGRSLAVMLTVACGVFIVLGVGLNRRSPSRYTQRDSGTGGFALWAETAMPLTQRPDEAFAERLARQADIAEKPAFVSMRQRRGDDASCLNLHRAQQPTVLGVEPEEFARREAFAFRSAERSGNSPWTLLTESIDENTIPAIGDYATVYWSLGLNLGDTLTMPDDRGQEFNLKIVAIMQDSVFQGRLLINERDFIDRFASEAGYSVFLVDADHDSADALARVLSRQLADSGAEVMTTESILQNFLRVENTYLAVFLALGGLGLVLGSVGAGLVLLFNVMDRRGELAMMQAMGFSKATIRKVLLAEHSGLFAAGLLAGGVAAAVAVLPSVLTAGTAAVITAVLLPVVIFLCGLLWVALASRAALKRNLLDNLRNE